MQTDMLRPLLAPLSWIYAIGVGLRHLLYDEHLLRSYTVDIPTICVGNIAMGGTGKTPMVEYLIRELMDTYHVAVLSRGYGRQSKGFQLANDEDTALTLGDEPMQIHRHFPTIPVAVCANRVQGIQRIQQLRPEVNCIILDDAFQYRRLRCGFNLILTAYDHLYPSDHIFPYGMLRDLPHRIQHADAVIVTKCPETITPIEMRIVSNQITLHASQQLAFSSLSYQDPAIPSTPLVLSAIAHPETVLAHIREQWPQAGLIAFPDHHPFTPADIKNIRAKATQYECIITTEKDMERLRLTPLIEEWNDKLYVLPIQVQPMRQMDTVMRHIHLYLHEQLVSHSPQS